MMTRIYLMQPPILQSREQYLKILDPLLHLRTSVCLSYFIPYFTRLYKLSTIELRHKARKGNEPIPFPADGLESFRRSLGLKS